MPKVSVILPNYNHEKYISRRLESILNQSFTDFEIIILDDASQDQSLEKIDAFKEDPRIKHLIVNKENSGSTFKQWEKGIELAQGKYIWIAESDDESADCFLEECIKLLENKSDIGLVYSPSKWIDEQSDVMHIPDHEHEGANWSGRYLIENDFLKGNVIYNASSAVFRKSLLDRVDFKQISDFKYAGDWMFWVQLIPNTQVARLDEKLNYFRRHPHNVSFSSDKKGLQFIEGLQIAKYIFNNYPISYFKQQKWMMYWAKKISITKLTKPSLVLKEMPLQVKFWYHIFSI